MYPAGQTWRDLVAGDHSPGAQVAAVYGSTVTELELDAANPGTLTESYSDGVVRTSLSLNVLNPDGLLTPLRATDPLAAMGSELTLQHLLSLGDVVDSVPGGSFLVDRSTVNEPWTMSHDRAVTFGGVIPVQASDLLQRPVESNLVGMVQPLSGGTVRSEVQRLCAGVIPVDLDSLPVTSLARRSIVYDTNLMSSIKALADVDGLAVRSGRNSALQFVPANRTTPVHEVTTSSLRWVGVAADHSREGVWNAVAVTGAETASGAPVFGYAETTDGTYGTESPLGRRVYALSMPFATSRVVADQAAQSMLARLSAERELVVEITATFDPSLDVLDTHLIDVRPGSSDRPLTVPGLLISRSFDLRGGPMTLRYSVARSEVVLG